jgi:hypothetical protein
MSAASIRASTDFPVPDSPPTAISCGGGGVIRPHGQLEIRLGAAFDLTLGLVVRLRALRRCNLGADRRAHRHEEGQGAERVEVAIALGLDQIAVENGIGRARKPALLEVHQQESEIVKHIARSDQRIELDRVEQHRLAVDQRDIAEMQVAMTVPHQQGFAAPAQQRYQPCKGLPAFGDQLRGILRRKQVRKFAEGLFVLADIAVQGVDPGIGLDRKRCAMGGGDGSRQIVGEAVVDCPGLGETVERGGFVEPLHLQRPLDRFAVAIDGQGAGLIPGDGTDAEIDLRREQPVDPQLRLARGLALVPASSNRETGTSPPA